MTSNLPDIVLHEESSDWSALLSNAFNDLRSSKSTDATVKASQALQLFVAEQAQELKGEFFSTFMHDVNQSLREMVRSGVPHEVYCVVVVLNHLMDVEYDANDGSIALPWAACLHIALYATDITIVIEESAKCFGRLVKLHQKTLPRETIDTEVREALELMNNRQVMMNTPYKRVAAVFVLAHILQNVPNLVNIEHVDAFLDAMGASIHYPASALRNQTAEVLRQAFRKVSTRVADQKLHMFQKSWAVAELGLAEKTKSTESIHGSLLVISVLLSEDTCRFITADKFQKISDLLGQLKNHKTELIRKTIIQMIPLLAAYPKEFFTDLALAGWVNYLIANATLKKAERSAALKAIGQVALKLGDRMQPQIDKVMQVISLAFPGVTKAQKAQTTVPTEVFGCISALAQAIGPAMEPFLIPILPQIFGSEFSKTLVITLGEVATHVPNLRERIQDTLLNVLSLILAREPYPHGGAPLSHSSGSIPRGGDDSAEGPAETPGPASAAASTADLSPGIDDSPPLPVPQSPLRGGLDIPNAGLPAAVSDPSLLLGSAGKSIPDSLLQLPPGSTLSSSLPTSMGYGSAPSLGGGLDPTVGPSKEPPEINSKVLALNTLATFGFDIESTKNLVHRVVVNYLEHENLTIRRRAVLACGKLLGRQQDLPHLKGGAAAMAIYVIQRLLKVSVTDLDSSIRRVVLETFDKRFDTYLAQPDFLRCLFLFLYDEVHEIRELAVRMLGRLAKRNPGYIHPTIRAFLLEFISGVTHDSEDLHKRENSARLLGLLIQKFPKLAKPYVPPLVQKLVKAIKDNQSPRHCASCLSALGDIAEVAGDDLVPYNEELLPLVIDNFQDQTSASKRDAALKALSQIIENTGCVIDPFLKYPKLLDTILNKIKREEHPKLRSDLVRLLGIVGALDPYKYKQLTLQLLEDDLEKNKAHHRDDLMKGISLNSEEYYPAVALTTLIKFLRNPYGNLTALQPMVVEAVMTIFKTLGLKCVLYLKHFMPLFLHVMQAAGDSLFGLRELVVRQLCVLVSIIKHYTRDYITDLFQVLDEYWDIPRLTSPLVQLIEEVSYALNDEFKTCVPTVIPKFLTILQREAYSNFQATTRILHAFDVFGETIDDHLHIIIPAITSLFFPTADSIAAASSGSGSLRVSDMNLSKSNPSTPRKPIGFREATIEVKIAAVHCIARLSRKHDLTRFAVTIMHPLVRLLDKEGPLLGAVILETLSTLAVNLGLEYHIYIRMVNNVMQKHQIVDSKYNSLVMNLVRGEAIELPPGPATPLATRFVEEQAKTSVVPKPNALNAQTLSQSWDTSRCLTKVDWIEWIRKLSIALLTESSSPALRSCAPLAKAFYPSVAREMFNAAFVSCWNELPYELQKDLTTALEHALGAENIPTEILQVLLDLAEYMEHNEKSLPIDIKTLATLASKCHAYAKALYYREMEMRQNVAAVDTNMMEELIGVTYKLQLIDSAWGLLGYAQNTAKIDIKLSWYEKLQKWSLALSHYEKMQQERPGDMPLLLGRMRCIHDLGNWDVLTSLAAEVWEANKSGQYGTEIATLALSAALNTQKWEFMEQFVDVLNEHTLDGSFYRAITALHKSQFNEAKRFINQARELAASELIGLIGESYSRAYSVVVRVQQLAELEESIFYKQADEDDSKKTNILHLWKKRLQGVSRNVEVWQQLLSVRSIVEPPSSNVVWWTKFANLVRRSDRPRKSRRILTYLLVGQNRELQPDEPIPDKFPMVKYAYLNLLWGHPDSANRAVAFAEMERWVAAFHLNSRVTPKDKARCYAKLARWQLKMQILDEATINRIVSTAKQAIQNAPEWFKPWHTWATVNYKFVTLHENPQLQKNPKLDAYLVPAINGFVKSIGLAPHDNLQDLLRLLTLWFKYGAKKEVEVAVKECFDTIHVDKWITVIPQLMARIHISLRSVRHGIHNVLTSLGKSHPQALVFPLTVAKQSPFPTRVTAAQSIMTSLRQYSSILLDETLLVSTELIRVAILWKEKFYKGLDEASRCYYIDKKPDNMAMVLQRLNEIIERGAETSSEQAFVKAFGKDLAKAWELTKDFLKSSKVSSINQAWELYGHVFRTIKRQLQTEFDKLHLKNVSPKLLGVKDLNLAVPGTYKPNGQTVRIKTFNPVLKVITSKQQPRKLVIHGSDGTDYPFLLKGHEDLRQDERVMQLFELVNTFLQNDDHTSKTHLNIRTFAVVPLSPNSGVIEWVPHCDTVHELIKQFRKTHNIPLDSEQLIIQSHTPIPDYYKLTPLQKLEIFEQALQGTSGQDLQRVMYLTSKNSEEWLDKRTTYTRSLAVMSMVGYILGLGDRHPNNLLLNRNSGQIIHIDFGDCFEVAMNRERFSEQIPFRLTRMLVNAMEVCGIQGTFKLTSEAVMRVLRHNSDSILAVLEAFVYDPLINWRLINTPFSPSPNEDFGDVTHSNPLEDEFDDDDTPGSAGEHGGAGGVHGRLGNGALIPDATENVAGDMHEALNQKALSVIERVSNKLTGAEIIPGRSLEVSVQVAHLTQEATNIENLCQMYLGWCSFW